MQAHRELRRADPQHTRRLTTVKPIPSDEQEDLLVTRIERRERLQHRQDVTMGSRSSRDALLAKRS
jgi:hypothetical protein